MVAPLLHVVYRRSRYRAVRDAVRYGHNPSVRIGHLDARDRGEIMATVEECRAALQKLAARLASNAAAAREKLDFDRSLACRVTDLQVAFHGQLQGGQLAGLTDGD